MEYVRKNLPPLCSKTVCNVKCRADDLVSFLTSSSALRLCVWLFDDGDFWLLYLNKRFLLAFRAI